MPRKKAARRVRPTKAEQDDAGVPLERFLVACQKSLGRAYEASHEASRSEYAFGAGNRPLFVIDELQFAVNAALMADERGRPRLDFAVQDANPSTVTFRVTRRPVELASAQRVELANLDPLLDGYPIVPLRITCVDAKLEPHAGAHVTLVVQQSGDTAGPGGNRYSFVADVLGRVELRLDLKSGALRSIGPENAEGIRIPFRAEGECYVWAEYTDAGKSVRSANLILPRW